MRLLKFIAPDDFNLFLFSDIHDGNRAFSRDTWDYFVNTVNSEFEGLPAGKNYSVFMGDSADFITRVSRMYEPDIHTMTPLETINDVKLLFEPIKHTVLAFLDSNHDQFIKELGNVALYICNQIWGEHEVLLKQDNGDLYIPQRAKYATESAKITFLDKDGNKMWKAFVEHGKRPVNSAADNLIRIESNQRLILQRHMRFKHTDSVVNAKAHIHKLLIQPPTPPLCMKDDTKKLIHFYPDPRVYHKHDYIPIEFRWYVATGSFLRLYALNATTYSERAEYDPVDLGFAVVLVRDKKVQDIKRVVCQ